MKNQPKLSLTAILAATVLAGIFAMVTTSIKINAEEDYGDSTEQKGKQSAAASGLNVDVHNCIENNIDSRNDAFLLGNTNPDCSDFNIPIPPSP
jgi:hypothetical protein